MASVIGQLPRDDGAPVIERVDFDAAPVLSISVYGDRPLREITEIADKQIKQRLESVRGIGSIQIVGGLKREIQIWMDSDKLQAYRLTIDQVRNAIRAQNVEVPGGRIDQGPNELVLRTIGRIDNVRDFETLVVASVNGAPVYLRDIARIEDGFEERRSLARQDGRRRCPCSCASSPARIRSQWPIRSRKTWKTFAPQLPPDIHADVIRDQSGLSRRPWTRSTSI